MTEYPYNDEHRGNSKLAYDGELIDAADASKRYDRDEQIREKYEEAEAEEGQLTFADVRDELSP